MRPLLPWLLLSMVASPGFAQGVPPAFSRRLTEQPSVIQPILVGVGVGALGLAAGVGVGAAITSSCNEEDCQLAAAVIGGGIGMTLGIALGAHLGNRRQGNLGLDLLGAAATGGLLLATRQSGGAASVIAIPVVQLVTSVALERLVGQRRASALTVAPLPAGGVALGLRFSIPSLAGRE